MSFNNVTDLFNTDEHNPSFAEICKATSTKQQPVDFCVPVNRHFPSDLLLNDIRAALPDIIKYYPDYAISHQQALAQFTGLPAESIVVANGSTELITVLCQTATGPFATDIPTFGRWTDLLQQRVAPTHFLQREHELGFVLSPQHVIEYVRRHEVETLILCNPNNPTGTALSASDVTNIVEQLHDIDLIVIDESFIDFADVKSVAQLAVTTHNLVVIKSLGKSLGSHGVRLGYSVSTPKNAERIRSMVPYWNINGIAAFVLDWLGDKKSEFTNSLASVRRDRTEFIASLSSIPALEVFPSQANFVLVKLPDTADGKLVRDRLLTDHNLLIRACGNKLGSSDQYLRLAVNLPLENARLITPLQDLLESPAASKVHARTFA